MRQQIYGYIVDDLTAKFVRGEMKPGDKLPSEKILSQTYGSSQTTVKKALKELVSLGFLRTVERVGYFVSEPSSDDYYFSLNAAVDTKYQITAVQMKGPETVTERMPGKEEAAQRMIRFSRVSLCSGTVIEYETVSLLSEKGKARPFGLKSAEEMDAFLASLERFIDHSCITIRVPERGGDVYEECGLSRHHLYFEVDRYAYDKYGKLMCFIRKLIMDDNFRLFAKGTKD